MQILSHKGFRDFSGIINQGISEKLLKIEFDDSSFIKSTPDHKFLVEDIWVNAFLLDVGDILSNKTITNIEEIEPEVVYDMFKVEEAHSYYSSGVYSHNCSFLYIDECAFVEGWTEFYKSVYPTISSGQETKVVLVSTPNGLNFYYKLWADAVSGSSDYIPIKVTWRDVPGRDEEWKRQTIANTSEEAFIQEHEAEFIGSAGTLIDGWRLKELVEETPIKTGKYAKMYEAVQENHIYIVVADVSRGKGIDNSAYIVVDVTTLPYKIVSTYYCAVVPPDMFAEFIYQAHIYYNDAYVVVENNDAGCETLRVLNDTYECESILGTMTDTQNRKVISINGGNGFEFGVRTTKTVKAVGCTRAKQLVESGSIQFGDRWLIDELNKFIRVGKSYEAQKDAHDDIAMCIHGDAKIQTEDGVMSMRKIVNSKYTGKVLSLNKFGKFEYKKVIAHTSRFNTNKKWIGIRGRSRNTLICTTDHRVAYIPDINNPEIIEYCEAQEMIGKYNVIQPGQRLHKTNPLFNKEQISVLVGTLMGDSSISKHGQFSCVHGKLQSEYTKHKQYVFGGSYNFRIKEYIYKEQPKIREQHTTTANSNGQTNLFRELFYPNGKKTVKNIINYIDEIALAYWYMDDGHKANKEGINGSVLLCTDSFDIDDHNLLIEMFENKFNIEAKIGYYGGKPRLKIDSIQSVKFWKLIAPYVIESMRYKLPHQYHHIPIKTINNQKLDYGAELITKIMDRNQNGWESKLYDIQVEDNNNFVANGMLVHNCLVIFSWLTTQYLFEDLTTIDTRFSLRNMKETEFIDDLIPFGYVTDGLDSYGDDTRVDFQSIELPDYEDTPFYDYIQNNRKLAKDTDGFFDD